MVYLRCPSHYSFPESTNISSKCNACEDHHDNKKGYKCSFCDFYLHEECINTNIPSRHKHPLKLRRYGMCSLCKHDSVLMYECSQCSFLICIPCARKPLIVNQPKAHEHELHQVPIEIFFTCDACGLCIAGFPCICHQCCFMIHRKCIFLPRVIRINRHDHRLSHVYSLGPGKWICEVCHEHVKGDYGAYSCSVCPYVVHSNCATNDYNWDGRDLEGVPEEYENEESKPSEVIDQNLIKHFSHEHNLKVSGSSLKLDEDKRCYACTLPLYSELCYKCTQCDFSLHDECAKLPRKKRHVVSSDKIILCAKGQRGEGPHGQQLENFFFCHICRRYCTGFSYLGKRKQIDVRCASVSDTFKHESHPHLLFVYYEYKMCKGCGWYSSYSLRCRRDDCGGFDLCFRCGTLPTSVRHNYDEHPLSLCYGEQIVSIKYCCGICEKKINSKNWFYKCNDCGSTLHIPCVFRNLIHSRPGHSLVIDDKGTFDLLPNNRLSRPICYSCKSRCIGDLVLNNKEDTKIFLCCSCGFPE